MAERSRETEDYPGVVVHDGRVSGSITLGYTRLPFWAITTALCEGGWAEVQIDYLPEPGTDGAEAYLDRAQAAAFLHHLLQHRRDFGRLLCVLADEDRRDDARDDRGDPRWWMQMPRRRARVRAALQACIDEIDREAAGD